MKIVYRRSAARSALAVVAMICATVQPIAPALFAGTQTPPATTPAKPATPAAQPATQTTKPPAKPAAATPAAAKPKTTTPAEPPPNDGGWPRPYTTPGGGAFIVYQPQVASWTDQKQMVAYSAVAYRRTSAQTQKPELGTIRIESETKVAVADRLVDFSSLRITEANFPSLAREEIASIVKEITDGFPVPERVIGLDRMLAQVDASQIIPKNVEGLKADPPTIFFSKKSAVLVNVDGEAVWSPVAGTDLKYAVNTNWDLFQHTPTGAYYLLNDKTCLLYTSPSPRDS